MSDIVTIAGSPSLHSRSTAALEYISEVCRCQGLKTTAIHVRDFDAEDLLYANFNSPHIKQTQQQVADAQAVIVATPVYKAAYSGALKVFLDILPQDALKDKIVLPIVTGGSLGHLLSIDYALKPVLSALGAQHILHGVYVLDSQIQRGERYTFAPEIRERLDSAATFLSQYLLKHISHTLESVS